MTFSPYLMHDREVRRGRWRSWKGQQIRRKEITSSNPLKVSTIVWLPKSETYVRERNCIDNLAVSNTKDSFSLSMRAKRMSEEWASSTLRSMFEQTPTDDIFPSIENSKINYRWDFCHGKQRVQWMYVWTSARRTTEQNPVNVSFQN